MQPPVFRRYNIADIPGGPDWLNFIFQPLNTFSEQTVNLFSGNLSVGENVQGSKYTVSFTTSATYGAGDFTPISYIYTGQGRPTCLLVGFISRADGTLITSPVTVTSWFLNTNTAPANIVVNYIAGLSPSTRYTVTLLAL